MSLSRVGYVLPVDRVTPRQAVDLAAAADRAGFAGVLVPDLFQPWLPSLGQAPQVWTTLATVAEHTHGEVAAGMVAAGYREHPAAIAHAAATLGALHQGRVWLAIGAGEAINEHVTGQPWPEAPQRVDRMFEAAEVIRRLFAGSAARKDVRFTGDHFTLESARLWTMPAQPPAVLVATSGPVTARRAGRSADGLLAVAVDGTQARSLLERFMVGVNESGRSRDAMLTVAHLTVSWADDERTARDNAVTDYPIGAMRFARGDLRSPLLVEQIARLVRADDLDERMIITADPAVIAAAAAELLAGGFDRVYLNNVGRNHQQFLAAVTAVLR